jgi:hypothetical protein
MIEIKKIVDKDDYDVWAQENCRVVGKPQLYVAGQDCNNDCTAYGKPTYYVNPNL